MKIGRINKGKIAKMLLVVVAILAVVFVLLAFWLKEDQKAILPEFGQTNSLGIDIEDPKGVFPVSETDLLAPQETPQTVEPVIEISETSNEDYESLLHSLGLNLYQNDVPENQSSFASINYCKKLVYGGLTSLPNYHVSSIEDLVLTLNSKSKRGLAGNGKLVIRCIDIDDEELISVLLHEMGHIVDGSYLVGTTSVNSTAASEKSSFVDLGTPVLNDDPSIEYYKFSWKNDTDWLEGSFAEDFCSRYGRTDPYEDFAECYIYYILHGEEFRLMAEKNEILRAKYEFLKTNVFSGITYDFDSENATLREKVPPDVVQLPYNYQAFLNQ